ncbi:hypothetical protein [Actinomadura rupiterrae]|uniref:hypothetical protein n=1 Tax=Actinomadura rupiterrae TaxID=559627 RepID=UPI0020A49A89|nr:hypothetical protein [Actinomadura rupiterrae]MCP2342912.1 tetratricopeptide (TPR) repeat protein [Actinomadura rupiterrae]
MEQSPVPPQARRPAAEAVEELLDAAPASERAATLVEYLKPETSGDSLAWITELAHIAEDPGLDLPQLRRACTDLAWLARLAEQRCPDDRDWTLARSGSRTQRLVLAYVHGQRLRFDYRFAELRTRCNQWLGEFHDDALVLSLAAFAALGSRASNGLDLYQRAIDAPDADDKSRNLALTAIWFAEHLDGSAEMLLSLSETMMARGEDNPNVHYRRATALRRLARYDEALTEIDLAIDLFGVGNLLVHEQYAQERRAIIDARDLRRQAESVRDTLGAELSERVDARVTEAASALEQRIEEASRQLTGRVAVAQELVSEGLLKMVEVLGLFVTLLGFLIGSGTVIIKAKTFEQRALTMTVVALGAIIFFALLRRVVGPRHPKP